MPQARDAENTATTSAEEVARTAQQIRGDATVAAALKVVEVGADGSEQAFATLGFETALDLQLLAVGPAELNLNLAAALNLNLVAALNLVHTAGDAGLPGGRRHDASAAVGG